MGALAALAAAGAVYTTLTSRHAPHPLSHAVLTVVVCASFVGAGLLAVRRRLYGSFGLLLAAVGFASLLGALHDANGRVPYAVGVLTANLVFAVLVHALLAYPDGRLDHAREARCSSSSRMSTCCCSRRSPSCSTRSRAGTATTPRTSS